MTMRAGLPILFDCSRMVARGLAGRMPTGIDRVCEAYRAHFAARAQTQAVVQVRGRARVLSAAHSARLFDLLAAPGEGFRRRLAALAAQVVASGAGPAPTPGALYLNVSHSDFDRDAHHGWLRAGGVRPVYLLHDLIPIAHPDFTTAHKTARHEGRVRRALEAASGIIANSHATAAAIRAYAHSAGLRLPPLLEAPLGATDLPVPALPPGLPPRATFVCVSTIETRKNHMLLLDVWQRLIAQLGERAPRLELIGRWGLGSEAVRRRYRSDPYLHRFITIRNQCDDDAIARALVGARALLAPSRAEGFGLPVAEALRLGVPVIASDLAAFREIGGAVPTYLDPAAPEAWLRMIREFAADGPERQRQLAMLRAWRAPDWRDHFALVEAWLERLLRPVPITLAERAQPAVDWPAPIAPDRAVAGGRR